METEKYFKEKLEKLGIENIEQKAEKFNIYYEFLVEYNQNVNLTAITEKDEVYEKHFIDSILPAKEFKSAGTMVDIGTGAGFPSFPIAIVRPDLNIYAVDSLNKRINFLNELIQKTNILNVKTFHSRAEDYAKAYRNFFDYAVCRAVSKLPTLLEYTLPLLKKGGKLYAYKSISYQEEVDESVKALKILGGEIEKILEYNLEISGQKRYIIVVKKVSDTPNKYPRSQNKPKTSPL